MKTVSYINNQSTNKQRRKTVIQSFQFSLHISSVNNILDIAINLKHSKQWVSIKYIKEFSEYKMKIINIVGNRQKYANYFQKGMFSGTSTTLSGSKCIFQVRFRENC